MKNKLSIIGCGYVGKAIYNGFSPYFDIKIYDKYQYYNAIEETIQHSEIIFICVPTPMNDDGTQCLSNIYDAVSNIPKYTNEQKIIIIKSTVLMGTTRRLQQDFPDHIFIFSPEFLTERTSLFDFINSTRIILGGENKEALDKVEKLHRIRFPHTLIFKTGFEDAELVKYVGNCFFAIKLSFFNEVFDICNKLNINYEEIRNMMLADNRISNSHTMVPGFDNYRGFGGKCLPKDLSAFIEWCKSREIDCSMFEAAQEVNERVREYKDWLDIKGATTNNNYGE